MAHPLRTQILFSQHTPQEPLLGRVIEARHYTNIICTSQKGLLQTFTTIEWKLTKSIHTTLLFTIFVRLIKSDIFQDPRSYILLLAPFVLFLYSAA